MTKLHKQYKSFLEVQASGVSESTLALMTKQLNRFPEPDGLTAAFFRKRMKAKKKDGNLLSPATIKAEVVLAKRFLVWAGMDTSELDKKNLKLKKVPKTTVTTADLYTQEELTAIFASCLHPRDRAMLSCLYETAVRAGELISMQCETVNFVDNGKVEVMVDGKTGPRQVDFLEAVPIFKQWFDSHPTGKGPIWVGLKRVKEKGTERMVFKPLTTRQLYKIAQQALDRAGIKNKRKILHMYRHSRITEFVRLGHRGPALWEFVGWTTGEMEGIYSHLSVQDRKDQMNDKVYDIKAKKETTARLFEAKICLECGTKNDRSSRICSECNKPLHRQDRLKELEEKVERLSRFQATIGEAVKVNIGTKKKPKWIEGYFKKDKENTQKR